MAAGRFVRGVGAGALTLLAGLLVAAPVDATQAGSVEPRGTASAPAGAGIPVSGPRAFSPNDDGVKDTARFRYVLDRAGVVTIEVRDASGETDPLTLRAGSWTTTSSSTGTTPWLTSGPYLDGDPRDLFLPPLLPSVRWSVETVGDDSFDVASFTLEMRYLAVGG